MGKTLAVKIEVWGSQWTDYVTTQAKALVKELIPAMEQSLQPASGETMGAMLEKLFNFSEHLGKAPANLNEATAIWATALHDIPDDLLVEAMEQTIKYHKFNTIPTPGEIREHVERKLIQRKDHLGLMWAVSRVSP